MGEDLDRIITVYSDNKHGLKVELVALFINKMEEIIGEGEAQFLTKDKLKEQIAWCEGREQLRKEQGDRLKEML